MPKPLCARVIRAQGRDSAEQVCSLKELSTTASTLPRRNYKAKTDSPSRADSLKPSSRASHQVRTWHKYLPPSVVLAGSCPTDWPVRPNLNTRPPWQLRLKFVPLARSQTPRVLPDEKCAPGPTPWYIAWPVVAKTILVPCSGKAEERLACENMQLSGHVDHGLLQAISADILHGQPCQPARQAA